MGTPALEPSYVLHSRRYGDSSLLLDLLTRDGGRVACIARGALRARHPDTRLQPFQRVLAGLRGRGEVLTLVRAEPAGAPCPLHGRDLYCGLYLNELIIRLTPRQDPHAALFDDYAQAIAELAGDRGTEAVLRRFEVRLLGHLGLGLSLGVDDRGRPVNADSRYTYRVAEGPAVATGSETDAVAGATLLALRSGRFDNDSILREARLLMRRVIDHHLDGRPLRSRELFRRPSTG